MFNTTVLVGRLVDNPIKEDKNIKVTLKCQRPYKNDSEEYEYDIVDVLLWDNFAGNLDEVVRKGDLIGIKGRLESKESDGKRETYVVAEKVTFLSQKPKDENGGE